MTDRSGDEGPAPALSDSERETLEAMRVLAQKSALEISRMRVKYDIEGRGLTNALVDMRILPESHRIAEPNPDPWWCAATVEPRIRQLMEKRGSGQRTSLDEELELYEFFKRVRAGASGLEAPTSLMGGEASSPVMREVKTYNVEDIRHWLEEVIGPDGMGEHVTAEQKSAAQTLLGVLDGVEL